MDFRTHTAFTGNATELAALAIECGRAFGLPVDPDKTSERLVRYYVSSGVLDRPERLGRDAAYGYRHLLQLLTARRMAQAGAPLSAIAEHNRAAPTRVLEDGLAHPPPTAAQLLVSRFKSGGPAHVTEPSPRLRAGAAPLAAASPSPAYSAKPPAPPPLALPDVLDEVRRLNEHWQQEHAFLHELRRHLDHRFDELASRQRELSDAIAELHHRIRDRDDPPSQA